MVGALLGIPVRSESSESAGGDETQGWNLVQARCARGIREVEAAKGCRERVWIVEFDKVVIGDKLRIGQPFVDLEGARVAVWLRDVCRTKGRFAQTPAPISQSPNRNVGQVNAENNRIEQRSASIRAGGEIDAAAAGLQGEA